MSVGIEELYIAKEENPLLSWEKERGTGHRL